jgi:pimeloyl-ACP methyl ester carboxylesterase
MTGNSTPAPGFALPALPPLREARVFGQRVCYYDTSEGPPLVLVHGVGGDADQWAFCLPALARSHRVIALDLPGFGRSDKPSIDYRIEGYVEMLQRFLDAIGVDDAALLGHSLGGWIVAAFALEFPARVTRLVLNDAVGIDAGAVDLPIDLNVSTRANLRRVFEFMCYDRSGVTDALVDLAYALHLERGDGATIRSVLETLTRKDEKLDGRLAGIAAPTLLLWGENDAVAPLAMAQAWQGGIAGARLVTIPRCGHLPPLERPEEFADAVTRFLESD